MGCDIHGFIEINRGGTWKVANALNINRDYDAFGCFFGVRNYARFIPLVSQRGLPKDASQKVREEADSWFGDAHSFNYITQAELKEVNWQEEADLDGRVHEYELKGETLTELGKAGRSSLLEALGVYDILGLDGEGGSDPEATIIEEDEKWGTRIYVRERLKREEVKGSFSKTLLSMEKYAKKYGSENVRMVVWFDN